MGRWRSGAQHLRARATWLGLAFCLGAASAGAETGTALDFARHGARVTEHDLTWLRAQLPVQSIRVEDPYETGTVEFEAVSFEALLDAVYSPSWREGDMGDELLFRCRDGYEPSVSVERFRRHRAWLAFARVGSAAFTIQKPESGEIKTIDLTPYYLVWESDDAEALRIDGDHGWPYQVVAVDLIRARARFPKMAPDAGATKDVERGFQAFRVHCSRCHQINGEGGAIGPELNGPTPFVRAVGRDWLRRWIDDPSTVAPNSRMPRLNPALPDRAVTIDDIIAYLDAIAVSKPASSSEDTRR